MPAIRGRGVLNRRNALAGIAGGIVVESKNGGESGLRTANGKMPRLRICSLCTSKHWIDAIEHYIQKNLADSQAN